MNLDYLQSDRINSLKDKMSDSQSKAEKERLLRMLVREITTKLNDVTIGSIQDGVEVLPLNGKGWFDTNKGEGLTCTTGTGSSTGILVNYILV